MHVVGWKSRKQNNCKKHYYYYYIVLQSWKKNEKKKKISGFSKKKQSTALIKKKKVESLEKKIFKISTKPPQNILLDVIYLRQKKTMIFKEQQKNLQSEWTRYCAVFWVFPLIKSAAFFSLIFFFKNWRLSFFVKWCISLFH